jgi:hypothetical protein
MRSELDPTLDDLHLPEWPAFPGVETERLQAQVRIRPQPLVAPEPVAWLCPRCGQVNAPHVNACTCVTDNGG